MGDPRLDIEPDNRSALLDLLQSAERVRREPFWQDLMEQTAWAKERAIQKITTNEMSPEEGRSVLLFLDMFSKMTQGVEVRLAQLEQRASHSEKERVWREQLSAMRRRNHG